MKCETEFAILIGHQLYFPAGVLWRRLLHRNGTFVPPAPPTRTRLRVKTDFRRKSGRSGRFQGVERASQPSIRFFPPVSAIFRAPGGRNGGFTSCNLTQKERRAGRALLGPRGPKKGPFWPKCPKFPWPHFCGIFFVFEI